MTSGGAGPIHFQDSARVQWRVTRSAAGDFVQLEFVSESGERRLTNVLPMDERAWAEVGEFALRVLLQQAEPA